MEAAAAFFPRKRPSLVWDPVCIGFGLPLNLVNGGSCRPGLLALWRRIADVFEAVNCPEMASRRTLGQVDSLFVTGSQVKRIQILLKLSVTVAGMLVIAFGLIYFVRAFDARSLPDLEPEHWMEFESEFGVEDENETDWEAYLDVENGLYAEIERRIHGQERSGSILDRYS